MMFHQTNNYSVFAKQDTNSVNDQRGNSSNSSASLPDKPTVVWESPEFEEFDLCMEVTAYVQQWD